MFDDGRFSAGEGVFIGESTEQIVAFSNLSANDSKALTDLGKVVSWGRNNQGQVGDGTRTQRDSPIDITSQFNLQPNESIIAMSSGTQHSSALTSDGRLFMWGSGTNGRLGRGTATRSTIPVDITNNFALSSGETIVQVSLGATHSSAVTSNGRLYMWGNNGRGRLGDGTTVERRSPIDITSQFGLSVGETIVQVALGSEHSAALTSDGRVFTWGRGGRLGDGTTTDQATPVAITAQFNLPLGETITQINIGSSGTHSSALTSEGRLFMWGVGGSGRLGRGSSTNSTIPVDITNNFSLSPGETLVQVSLGSAHSSAVTSLGRLFMWGSGESGRLGTGNTTDRTLPTEVTAQFGLVTDEVITDVSLGGEHSSVITSLGRLFMFGGNNYGQLGDGGITDSRLIPYHLVID